MQLEVSRFRGSYMKKVSTLNYCWIEDNMVHCMGYVWSNCVHTVRIGAGLSYELCHDSLTRTYTYDVIDE
jgi:hypothetical protein